VTKLIENEFTKNKQSVTEIEYDVVSPAANDAVTDAANDPVFDEVQYIKTSTLVWKDIWTHFGMNRDNGGRYFPGEKTQDYVCEYLGHIRTPSRSWPNSYAKAMLTQKFAKLVVKHEPALALKLGIAEKVEDK